MTGSTFELPVHAWDEIYPQVSAPSFAVLLAIYRYGRQQADSETGARRVYVSASIDRLATMARVSRRSVQRAQRELQEIGAIRRHEAKRPNSPDGWSAPYDALDAATKGVPRESPPTIEGVSGESPPNSTRGDQPVTPRDASLPEFVPEGGATPVTPCQASHPQWWCGGDLDPDLPVEAFSGSPTTTIGNEGVSGQSPLVDELRDLGVASPETTVARFGEAACRVALRQYDRATKRWSGIQNPAGFYMTRLKELVGKPGVIEQEMRELETEPADRGYLGGWT